MVFALFVKYGICVICEMTLLRRNAKYIIPGVICCMQTDPGRPGLRPVVVGVSA